MHEIAECRQPAHGQVQLALAAASAANHFEE
jgi:hypothetical protein